MSTTTAYASIVKHERDAATGDLLVYGRATSDDLDLDQQVCDPTWLGKAMPEWFASGANVREQHSSIAAGIGTELKQLGSAWDLSSRVVDPVSARKVEAGVLKGYSVGIRNAQVVKDATAPNGRIVGGQIVEVSLVDRPANPTCTLTLAKALKPGPSTATADDVDSERRLLKVEELTDRTGEPLAALKALDPDLAKGDPARQARDIAGAQDAIATIAALIQSEAQCLADGAPSEVCDIDLLLSSVRALEWFICREKETLPMAHIGLSDDPETTKGGNPFPPKDDKPAGKKKPGDGDDDGDEELDAEGKPIKKKTPPKADKADGADLTELVKAAVAEAVAPIQAQLAKAMEQPAPGGPVLTRTTEDTTKAVAREGLLAKAAEYERIAYGLNGPDRDSYLQLAADTRAGATIS